jgi:hypothetical protein
MFDDNLCNLASRLVQDDAEVVLCMGEPHAHSLNARRTFERTLWVGSEAFGSLNT